MASNRSGRESLVLSKWLRNRYLIWTGAFTHIKPWISRFNHSGAKFDSFSSKMCGMCRNLLSRCRIVELSNCLSSLLQDVHVGVVRLHIWESTISFCRNTKSVIWWRFCKMWRQQTTTSSNKQRIYSLMKQIQKTCSNGCKKQRRPATEWTCSSDTKCWDGRRC